MYNICCSEQDQLIDFIQEIESDVGKEAIKKYLPMQQGDVYQTYADTSRLESETGYKPKVSLHEGITRFMDWYKSEANPLQ